VQLRAREKKPRSTAVKTAISDWKSLPTLKAVKKFQQRGQRAFKVTKQLFDLTGEFIRFDPNASPEELISTMRAPASLIFGRRNNSLQPRVATAIRGFCIPCLATSRMAC
jgi:hypothetical protein